MMKKEWQALPYISQQRLMITANIPYFFRWKIYNLKLLFADLETLRTKYRVVKAGELYDAVYVEAEILCAKIAELIKTKQAWVRGLEKEKEAVPRDE